MSRTSRIAACAFLVAAIVAAAGCGKRLQNHVGLLNQPPTIQIEPPVVSNGSGESITARVHWTATDNDGRVDHYLVTRDLAALNKASGWSTVVEREQTLGFRRATRTGVTPLQPARDDFEFLAVRAVDDQGAASEPGTLVLFNENVAPTVRIVSPQPSALIHPSVPPSVWITWQGSDPDGPNGRPAKYKYRLFRQDSHTPWDAWYADPDSLRRQFAPGFAGWDSIGGDSTRVRLTNLDVNHRYLFAITALDAEGAYDPVFSWSKNLLEMDVVPFGSRGPVFTFFNSNFTYTYPSGGIPPVPDSNWVIRTLAPAGQPLTVHWYAEGAMGTSVAGYRWALDIADIADEKPRHNRNDLAHWSAWDLSATSATLGPFRGPDLDVPHRLYVEATDDVGQVSLGIVEFRFVRPVFDRDLLIVDDTRFQVDYKAAMQPAGRTDSLRAPYGPWPSRAELDTFLFAVGGMPWRMKTPWMKLSPPGIFKGYRFDTLGTRYGLADPTVSLELLGHYRHVVWITDRSDSYNLSPTSQTLPMATLAYMSGRGRQNTLATWVSQGGKLWALGGGFGNATNSPWNNSANDSSQTRTYSSLGARPDLGLGRFMYDIAHWRSEFKVLGPGFYRIARAPFPPGGRDAMPSYTTLPANLRAKQPSTDPLWPNRQPIDYFAGNQYFSIYGEHVEYLSKPNRIIDDWNPAPWCARDVSALDTLMVVTGSRLPSPGPDPAVDRIVNPVMTNYHGSDCGSVVFSGFDCWTWTRADCVGLVDAVLQGSWGLSRNQGTGGAVVTRGPSTSPLPVARRTAD